MKNVAVLTEDGAFAVFFRPHPGGFDSSRVPSPRSLPSKAQKILMPGGQPRGGGEGGGWVQLEFTDALFSQVENISFYPSIRIGVGKGWPSSLRKSALNLCLLLIVHTNLKIF